MAGTQLFRSLRKAGGTSQRVETDSQLLARFLSDNDSQAFEEIVRRHGPMIMALCRQLLDHDQDAEDAFQAAFAILARKAKSISKRQSLASWLYKVAHRIALRARGKRARQRTRENGVDTTSRSAPQSLDDREIAALVDEEIQRLPGKYRDPIVLCYLQGRSTKEAARELACPVGTIKIRLLRGRKMLHSRLTRRGIGLSIAALLGICTEMAEAALPPEVQSVAVRTANAIRCSQSFTDAGLSSTTEELVSGWQRRLGLAKLKLAGAVLLILGMILLVDGLTQKARGAVQSSRQAAPATETTNPAPPSSTPSATEQFISGAAPLT